MTGNCTATISRDVPGGRDKYGDANPPADSGSPATTELVAAAAPGLAPELAERARDGVVVDVTLYLPATADVQHTDTVTLEGACAGTYRVEGHPQEWSSPFTGWRPGFVAFLKRAEG